MPDHARSLAFKRAVIDLEARIREEIECVPERLSDVQLKGCYPKRPFIAGWRCNVQFSDGETRQIDILASEYFPDVKVRTALVDPPQFLKWPHIERDGVLCLLPNMAEGDPDDPAGVAVNLFKRSCVLIEELLEGSIIERDFKEEFLTYWAYDLSGDMKITSLIEPMSPSRKIWLWEGKSEYVVGDSANGMKKWLQNRYDIKKNPKLVPAIYLWLDEPLLPAQYPKTAAEMLVIVQSAGESINSELAKIVSKQPEYIQFILGAEGRGGPGLVSVTVQKPGKRKSIANPVEEPLTKGFRTPTVPSELLLERYFSEPNVIRNKVVRADPIWIHGRGKDIRTEHLLGKTAIIFGCGSIGAPIAVTLAQAGISRLILVDFDTLSWANVGRHPLGASAVDANKAEALAERLQLDFPHLDIIGHNSSVHPFLLSYHKTMLDADIVVAATGSWAAESTLNRWQIANMRRVPFVYCWTEAHACAGHAVSIAKEGGCFQCGISRTGASDFVVVDWPDGGANKEEPACGAHYQPYGPVELGFIVAMMSEKILDCLLDAPVLSDHRIFAAPKKRIEEFEGDWTKQWLSIATGTQGGEFVTREWLSSNCLACGS